MSRLLPSRLNSRLSSPSQRRRAWLALWAQDRRRGRAVRSVVLTLLDGLIAHWKLDEAVGDMRLDSVGSRHLYDEGGCEEIISSAGVIGGAADYSSASYGLLADGFSATLSAEFSVSMWVYNNPDANDWGMAFHLWSPTEDEVFRLQAYPPYAQYYIGQSGTWGVFEAGGIFVESDWTHLVVTVSATTAKMYANGVLHQSWSVATSPIGYTQLRIGGNYLGYPWLGRLDEVGMWGRLLSADEVSQLYNVGDGLACELF